MESSPRPPEVLDQATLARLRALQVEGEPPFLAEMVDIYLCHAPGVFENVHQAIEEQDAAAYREAVHRLKSSSLSLGACRLAACCCEIEALVCDGQVDLAFAGYACLESEYNLALQALQKESER